MPRPSKIVINTGPTLALIAATDGLKILRDLYDEVLVPLEVAQEIKAGGPSGFGVETFDEAVWLKVWSNELEISPYLANTLDKGEAAVIQLALDEKIATVCIDETVGRRVASLNGLKLTGAIGVLLRAKSMGVLDSVASAIEKMRTHGIWVSDKIVDRAAEIEKNIK